MVGKKEIHLTAIGLVYSSVIALVSYGFIMAEKVIVINKKRDRKFKDSWWGFTFVCPNCKERGIWDNFSYCPDCGAKIEWQGRE